MAGSPAQGVVDRRNRVFGYKNMYVCDGSVVAANLGVNPSLTICALTERAMSYIPPAAKTEWNDAAEAYVGDGCPKLDRRKFRPNRFPGGVLICPSRLIDDKAQFTASFRSSQAWPPARVGPLCFAKRLAD